MKAGDTPSDFIRWSWRSAKIAWCARCGNYDFPPRSGYKIADIWHVIYRLLNTPALPSPAIFSPFHSESPVKLIDRVGPFYQMTFQNGERHRKLFLNRWKRSQFDNTVVRKALFDVASSVYSNLHFDNFSTTVKKVSFTRRRLSH